MREQPSFVLFPEQASTLAGRVDDLGAFMFWVSALSTLLIAFGILYFSYKYRRRPGHREPDHALEREATYVRSKRVAVIEASWTVLPFLIMLVMFAWGARVYASITTVPKDASEVYVVGKQWMWHLQHPGGQREINELHVPSGRPIKLIMTSQDVIHSFFLPAFRIKHDVLPDRYTTLWFEANKVGTFHLFCAEYCGTKHSGMIGRVVVMRPNDYEAWLSQGGEGSLASSGEKVFQDLGCATCHLVSGQGRGPTLAGLYRSNVALGDGSTIVADESYLRESILNPNAKIVAGFQPIMPSFQALVSEEGLVQLIAYIKSLSPAPAAAAGSISGERGIVGSPVPSLLGSASAAPSAVPQVSAGAPAPPLLPTEKPKGPSNANTPEIQREPVPPPQDERKRR